MDTRTAWHLLFSDSYSADVVEEYALSSESNLPAFVGARIDDVLSRTSPRVLNEVRRGLLGCVAGLCEDLADSIA